MARTKSTKPAIERGRSIRRDDGTVFKPGDEEELAKVITAEEIRGLSDRGVITGTWSPAPTAKSKETGAAARRGRPPANPGALPDAADAELDDDDATSANADRDPERSDGLAAPDRP